MENYNVTISDTNQIFKSQLIQILYAFENCMVVNRIKWIYLFMNFSYFIYSIKISYVFWNPIKVKIWIQIFDINDNF